MDETLSEVKLTLWGDKATSTVLDWRNEPIVAFKGLKVGDFGGRSLSTLSSSSIQVAPELNEGRALHGWKIGFQNGVIPMGASLTTGGELLGKKYMT